MTAAMRGAAIPGWQAIRHTQQPFEEAVRGGNLDRLELWHALRFLRWLSAA